MSNHPGDDRAEVTQELEQEPRGAAEDGDDGSSPFDHPAFLPVVVSAFALWFGFDGWFNPKTESILFNRYGFGFLLGAAIFFTLDEYARLPYLLPALFLAYAAWLGSFALFGGSGDWYHEGVQAQLFNRWAAVGFLALAALAALREAWRRRRGRAPAR